MIPKPPANASAAHKALLQYFNAWNASDLGALSATMDDESFKWVMLPESLGIPVMNKQQTVPYLKDILMPTLKSFTIDVGRILEVGDNTVVTHVKGDAVSKLGTVLKNEYMIIMDFVPSKVAGELPKISNYTEFMDSKALTDFMAAEDKVNGVATNK